jgi:hypothetical protein
MCFIRKKSGQRMAFVAGGIPITRNEVQCPKISAAIRNDGCPKKRKRVAFYGGFRHCSDPNLEASDQVFLLGRVERVSDATELRTRVPSIARRACLRPINTDPAREHGKTELGRLC